MHPREFFDVFLQPAVDDWRRDKMDERRAIQLDAGPKYRMEKIIEEGRKFWDDELKRNHL